MKNASSNKEKLAAARLTGSFTVTVRELLADYVFDDTTLACAVVTGFQDSPFVLYVGEEIASQLKIGQQYTFTIADQEIGMVPESEIGKELSYLQALADFARVEIASFRLATEDEMGLGGNSLQIVAAD